MKRISFYLILISLFCAFAFAQTNQNSPCPTISVTGPASVTVPGEVMIFTADVSKDPENINLKYVWAVNGGELIGGQGTSKIEVKTPKKSFEITATVEVLNLPKECKENKESLTTASIICSVSLLIDEFSVSSKQIDKERLDNLINEFRKNTDTQIYIIEKYTDETSPKNIQRKNQLILEYLKSKGIERNQIILLNGSGIENQTQFVFVPFGAAPPDCELCETVR